MNCYTLISPVEDAAAALPSMRGKGSISRLAMVGQIGFDLRQVRFPRQEPTGDNQDSNASHSSTEELYAVRVMDNPVNTYDEVMAVCARALAVTADEAFNIAYTVDHEGSCVVCVGPKEESERVAGAIRSIGIEVRLEQFRAEA